MTARHVPCNTRTRCEKRAKSLKPRSLSHPLPAPPAPPPLFPSRQLHRYPTLLLLLHLHVPPLLAHPSSLWVAKLRWLSCETSSRASVEVLELLPQLFKVVCQVRFPPVLLLTSLNEPSANPSRPPLADYLLTDVLPSSLLTSLLRSTPSLATTLLPYLPSEIPQTPESLDRAITSPEFKRSVASLDRALRTGALGPLVQGLGLGDESAMGVEAFLEGVVKQAEEKKEKEGEGEAKMETEE